jgi:Matrixin
LLVLPVLVCSQLSGRGQGQPQAAVNISNEALAIPPVDLQPPHFVRIDADKDTGPDRSDYLSGILNDNGGRVFRYKTMPVKIYIEPTNSGFMPSCLAACRIWETRSQGLVSFVQVLDPAEARIKIEWVHQGINPEPGSSAGAHTMMKWHYKTGPTLKSVVGLPVPTVGRKFTVPAQIIEINLDPVTERVAEQQPILVRNVTLHELGHALGLIGHSPARSDIMYKDTDEYSRISERDLNTLKRLYHMKVDVPL